MFLFYWLYIKINPIKGNKMYVDKVLIPYLHKLLRDYILNALSDPDVLKNKINILRHASVRFSRDESLIEQIDNTEITSSWGKTYLEVQEKLPFNNLFSFINYSDVRAVIYQDKYMETIKDRELFKFINHVRFAISKNEVTMHFTVNLQFLNVLLKV